MTHENKTELWHCSELNTTSDHIKNMSHSAGAKLRSNVIIHNTSRLLIFHHTCEKPSDNLSPPGSHTAQGPMTLTPGRFLQHCWWADVFHKHKGPNSWTVITETADESRLGNQVTGQVLLWPISSGYHKYNLFSSEGNPVCILQDCSTTRNRAQEEEITPQAETVSAKHNPYLNKNATGHTLNLLPLHHAQHSRQPQNQTRP